MGKTNEKGDPPPPDLAPVKSDPVITIKRKKPAKKNRDSFWKE